MGEANRNREAVMAEAADWLARLDASDRDASLKEAFESWRAESPSHAVALARLKGAWELSGQLQPAAARPKPTNTPMQMKPGWLISAAAAAGAIILVVATADPTVSYATQVGERRVIELGQGQSLTLNTDSRVEVRRRRSGALVRLTRGEVLVTSRSGAPPIHLSAGSLNLQTSGSTFDMRLTPQGARVAVVVGTVPLPGQSGRSEAANAGDVADIQAGEVVGSVRPMPAEVQRTVAWRTGRLEFDGQTLGEVVAEFNRYNRTKLSVAPEVAALRIGGGYDIDSPDAFAASTARAFDLKLRHQDDTLEISR
ncbi:FecR family protein [Phenylobacterium montanum]|uniref:FecR domain-containing protein n=1 Tax=Phenylobacterium montanum TaxID=2823693 RepID=A0A975G1V0_9CAUL|nr:FecR domain-containing protein [Caulobacter sp. S6]QUD89578.1 FecR domain-containing protein [Caulobacter sp. S6]